MREAQTFSFCLTAVITIALFAFALSGQASTLIVGGTQAPGTLGNPYGSSGQPASMVWSAIYDGLTEFDVDGNIRPALAKAWDNPDPLTWRFHLRDNVTFHNGRPFKADAVVGTFSFLLSDVGRRQLVASRLSVIERVEAQGDYTVVFTTRVPDAILPKRLSLVMIIEPQAWADMGVDAYAIEPVGTGPYRLQSWGAGNARIVLASSGTSWRGHGVVDQVVLQPLPDPAARLQALLSGQVDIAWNMDPDARLALERGGGRLAVVSLPNVQAIALRTEGNPNSPLQSKKVRRALNYAIDKKAMAEFILGGIAEAATQGAVNGTVGYDPAIEGYPYDPERARSLLTEAGYVDGIELTIEVTARLLPGDTLIFQKMAADLAAVGVRIQLRDLPLANFIRKYSSNQWGDTDAFSMTWNSAPMYDAIRPFEYYSCLKVNPFVCDQSIAESIVASNSAMNPQVRDNMLQAIMREMVDYAPAIFLTSAMYMVGLSDRIENFTATGLGINYGEVTFKE